MAAINRSDLFFSVRERIDEEIDAIIDAGDTNRIETLAARADEKPDYPDLRYRLAHLYFLRGDYAAAIREAESALRINAEFLDALHLKATILSSQGELEAALELYQQSSKRRPNDAESHYRTAVILGRLGKNAEAVRAAEQAVASNRGHQLAHVFLGEHYLFERDWVNAIGHYRSANSLRPHEDFCYVLGLLHLKAGQIGDGERCLEEALKLKPNHLNSCVRLAIIKVASGEYERAHTLLRVAIGFYPRYPDLHYSLAKVALLMGNRDEAYEMMRTALEINPRYAEVKREMGYLYSIRQMNREAVDELQQSLELNPDDEQAYINLGFILSNQGNHDRAVEVLEQAISHFPDSWRLYHSLGIVHLQEKAFPKARASFTDAIKINPELEALQRSLRITFQDESLLEDERGRLERLFAQPEQRSELEFHLGVIHLEFNKEKAAIGHFQNAIEAGLKTPSVSVLLATIYSNLQSFDQAIRTLESSSFNDRTTENVRRMLLGLFHANAGDHDVSARYYQQVMTDAPLFFHAVDGLPICFREREELDDMLDDYLDYARFHERSSQLFGRIGEIHANKGMLVEAKQHFHHASILDPNNARAYHALGILHLLRMETSVAVDFFLKAVEKAPDWAIPHLNLGLVYMAQNRSTLASVSLRRYVNLETKSTWRDHALALLEQSKRTANIAPAPVEGAVSLATTA